MSAELFGFRSTHRAGICASAAINAGLRIDHVDAVAFRNSGNGASIRARTTADARITDLVSHELHLPLINAGMSARYRVDCLQYSTLLKKCKEFFWMGSFYKEFYAEYARIIPISEVVMEVIECVGLRIKKPHIKVAKLNFIPLVIINVKVILRIDDRVIKRIIYG